MAKIVAWFQGLPLGLRAGLVGFILGAVVCAGITGIITGRQLHNLRESEAATVAALAELERQNQELASNFGAIKAGLIPSIS